MDKSNRESANIDCFKTALKEFAEAGRRENNKASDLEACREFLGEMTIGAKVKQWDIFNLDWDYLKDHPCLSIQALAAISVGLHPYFANIDWVFNRAIPYFEGLQWAEFPIAPSYPSAEQDIDPPQKDGEKVALLHEFIKRLHVIAANIAPRGNLNPMDTDSGYIKIRTNDFIDFATDRDWNLPNEFKIIYSKVNNSNSLAKQNRKEDQIGKNAKPKGKRDEQIDAIIAALEYLGFADPKNIPEGGKTKIKSECLKNTALFTSSGFDHAWKKANKFQIISMENKEKYL